MTKVRAHKSMIEFFERLECLERIKSLKSKEKIGGRRQSPLCPSTAFRINSGRLQGDAEHL